MADSIGQFVNLERQDGVLLITLNRSPVNAFHGPMHAELADVLKGLPADRETRVAVLRGAGKHFCAGGDIGWFAELESTGAYAQVMKETWDILLGLLNAPQPVIAMVRGAAIGLGASLALCCDIAFAAESARFADPHVQIGLVPGDGGAALWPLLVGPARAKEYLLTGDPILAPEAARVGLINRAVPDAELEDTVMALARRLAAGPPLAIRWTKEAVNQGMKATALQVLATSMGLEAITFRSTDCKEAAAAFKEKRTPVFTGV